MFEMLLKAAGITPEFIRAKTEEYKLIAREFVDTLHSVNARQSECERKLNLILAHLSSSLPIGEKHHD